MKLCALDFESWVDNECSLKKLPLDAYIRHPAWHVYMISVWDEKGLVHVGAPTAEARALLSGYDGYIAHNISFERAVLRRLDWTECLEGKTWVDTADLAVYFQVGRSLRWAQTFLLPDIPPKMELNLAAPKEFDAEGFWKGQSADNESIREYCAHDSELSWLLWTRWGHLWPAIERRISQVNAEAGDLGVLIDWPLLAKMKEEASRIAREAKAAIPYTPALSLLKLKIQCQKEGILPPASTSQANPDFTRWLDDHHERVPWVRQLQRFRKANRFAKIFQTMERMRREDDTIASRLLYYGAELTGRFAGTAGLNFQNFNREAWNEIDPRAVIVPRPGYKLAIADLSQIEPRCLNWLAGNMKFFDFVRQYGSVYVAAGMAWEILKSPDECSGPKKQLIKALVLGCGYGAGAITFQRVAKTYGIELTIVEAEERVNFFRTRSPEIVGYWYKLLREFERAGRTHKTRLPSGRILRYRNIRRARDVDDETGEKTELLADTRLDAHNMTRGIWHGKLCENVVSGCARDVFCEAVVRLADMGFRILFTAHDEVVAEVPEAAAEKHLAVMISELSRTPAWLPGIVLGAEGSIEERYLK